MPSDIEIAQAATLDPINTIAERLGIPYEAVEPYGHYKAKIDLNWLASQPENPDAHLILVTAMSPTPAGEGKTTTSVGLGDGLAAIGKRTMICLREPSLGPVFGMKGGAAGGGHAQIVPMEDINLHFTGDFHAIGLAHNLLAALIDNHIHHGNALGIDLRRITWKRVMDMNDRALRDVVVGLGGPANGYPREDGFDITVASEIMAIFCLAESLEDLKERIGRIVIGYTRERQPITAAQLNAAGAMTVLLKDAFQPNLVQSLEHTPAFVHGGPFANIAHGCNSVIATKSALKLADYVVTEAGFGADLGAEKFLDIKCRKSGLWPSAAVVVATIRAIKHHGGTPAAHLGQEDLGALQKGLVNLERHVKNVNEVYGIPCVVSINRFTSDTDAEVDLVREHIGSLNVDVVIATHWSDGGAGTRDLALRVIELCEQPHRGTFVYADDESLLAKVNAVVKKVYGATEVTADSKVRGQIADLQAAGYGSFPVCIAKTQYSFSTDPGLLGAPSNHSVNIREVRLAAGAEFIVMVCGDIMTMPGLPKVPSSERIDLVGGKVTGLF